MRRRSARAAREEGRKRERTERSTLQLFEAGLLATLELLLIIREVGLDCLCEASMGVSAERERQREALGAKLTGKGYSPDQMYVFM